MKHVKLFEQFLSEGKADLPAGMEKFMAGFPDNATSWSKATDELSELAWLMREFHVTIDQDLLLDEPGAYPEPPKSRGGGDTWSNLVTCCKRCNGIKDNKTPEEAGMVLKKRTFAPTLSHLLDLDPKKLMAEIMAKAYGKG